MRKVQKSERSGAGSEDIYTPTLWCFDALSFLHDGNKVRASVTNMDTTVDGSTSEMLTYSDHEARGGHECRRVFRSADFEMPGCSHDE
ncbi:hypothetical protein Pcinc_013479 [Petrolisthes cinctipes]|uniref:Uncharacterized protein n=1 Tax=Petrolisthes cinctipes TaxID=88211 RepID=A0AAE1FYH4_PETCI|nr:hypothetical protein Pcinc_013479 [Petrolisthes cinctipes]